MNDYFGFDGVDDEVLRREKDKASELRRTRWWQHKLATGICHYCGGRFERRELTMDHLVPLARGGRSTKSNLLPACKDCNNRKKAMLLLEWEEYLLHGVKHSPSNHG